MARNERGEVLDIGRKSRVIPPSLRRAVLLRDQHRCVFPGCTHERFLDLHHIEHWMNGGETKLDNLVALCTYHHGWIHEGGWRMERDEDGAPRFVAPERPPLPWMHRAPILTDDPIAELRSVQADLEIDDETALTSWDGSPMDLEACVSACCDAGEEEMSFAEWLTLRGRELSMPARA